MNMADALAFAMKDTPLETNIGDATWCFGMSKMTVKDENLVPPGGAPTQYNKLEFVEFLEFIGRLAELRFRKAGVTAMPLAQMVEAVLDLILPEMLGETRRAVAVRDLEESESDDDY